MRTKVWGDHISVRKRLRQRIVYMHITECSLFSSIKSLKVTKGEKHACQSSSCLAPWVSAAAENMLNQERLLFLLMEMHQLCDSSVSVKCLIMCVCTWEVKASSPGYLKLCRSETICFSPHHSKQSEPLPHAHIWTPHPVAMAVSG